MFLLLLTISAWHCPQHSRNLGLPFGRALYMLIQQCFSIYNERLLSALNGKKIYLQLPMVSGHLCWSIGKSDKSMLQLARIVSLQ